MDRMKDLINFIRKKGISQMGVLSMYKCLLMSIYTAMQDMKLFKQ